MRTPYTKATALAKLAEMGKTAVAQTKQGYWPMEDNATEMPRAEIKVVELRKVYLAVNNDADALAVLKAAQQKIGGIEGNFLRLVALDLYGVDLYNAKG